MLSLLTLSLPSHLDAFTPEQLAKIQQDHLQAMENAQNEHAALAERLAHGVCVCVCVCACVFVFVFVLAGVFFYGFFLRDLFCF